MTYLIEINGGDVTSLVEIGFSIVEKLDEALDIGAMDLKFTDKATPYSMFDIVTITIDSVEEYSFRVGGDSVSLASKKPLLYNHTLSLVEHTKLLERVIISGKTFTQPTDGSTALSLYDVINTLRIVYPLETSSNFASTRVFTIPSALETYLDAIESPEFTFKDITLREAINQVLNYVDGIARLNKNNELEVDFFNELQDLINDETGNYNKNINQDIEFYGTDITVDALNMVNDTDINESVEIYPSDNGFTTARCDQYIFDFTKSYIPTPKPIYQVSKLITRVDLTIQARVSGSWYNVLISSVNVNGYMNVPAYGYKENSIEPRLLEFDKYKLLDADETNNANTSYFLQSNSIYYDYGERNITQNMTVGIFGTNTVMENFLEIMIQQYLEANSAYLDDAGNTLFSATAYADRNITINTSYNDYLYQVHYTPVPKSTRFNIDRQDLTDVDKKTSLMTNQQSRIVNTHNFTNNIEGKINKIGNSEMSLYNRVSDIDDIYNVSDYTDENYIITVKEIKFYNDYFECSYELSRNWNKLSQFLGVNSEIRQWEIGEAGRTLERDLIYKEFIEINVVASGTGSDSSQFIQSGGIASYLNTFLPSSTESQVTVGMMVGVANSVTLDTILIPISSNGGGNNLLFRFQFNHNVDAGSYKDVKTVTLIPLVTQTAMQYAPYADSDDATLTSAVFYMLEGTTTPSTDTEYFTRADLVPLTNLTYGDTILIKNDSSLYIYKDNREILSLMFQFQQISLDTTKVILGRTLSNRNRLVNVNPPTSIKLHTYVTKQFGKNDNRVALSGSTSVTITPTISTTNKTVSVTHANLTSSTSSWCLTDENDNLLIAVNQSGTLLDTITFDFLNKRSGIDYDY